jgi:putative hemolysin
MQSEAFTYSSPRDPLWKRWAVRAIEDLSGRRGLLPVYYRWRRDVAGKSPRMMGELLEMVGATIELNSPIWPPVLPADAPLVIVANHPFGIGDGIALLALAEQLGRPYRILINSDFMRVPEIRPVALPIDFSGMPEATETNIRTRREARRLLQDGITIVVFPGGGVATAEQPFGKAEELPWKSFTARLVQLARAAVLPVYFEGQNRALFHLVSRYSLSLRLALLVSEFRHRIGATIKAHVGEVVPFAALEARADRNLLTEELYACVHRLAPEAAGHCLEDLKARPAHVRRQFPWDKRR